MKKISLKTIYLVALTAVFLVSFFAFAAFDLVSQQKQAEESLLEEARTFAKEMDAVWQFMDNSQKVINTSADGDYDFKGLHCSIVGKSVGAIFSAGNDYTIRYTNFNPRSIQDKPDAFEAAALESFDADAATREYYGVAEFDGEERFRYLQALEVDESCLECHGEPVGEIDITGHAKEGWTLDSVGGAISIVIPMDQQNQAMMGNVMRDVAFFLMLTVLIGAVIYLVTTFFVFRPIDRMKVAFGEMGEGRLGVLLDDRRASKEVASLIARFNDMAAELRAMYEHLEDQVASRTHDLQEANAALERQRDDLEDLSCQLAKEARFKSDLLSMVNHELRTPLAILQTKLELFAEEHPAMDAETAGLVSSLREQLDRLTALVRTLLEMSNLQSISRTDQIALAPLVEEILTDLTPLAQKNNISLQQDCAELGMVGSDALIYRLVFNLVENGIKYNRLDGAVRVTLRREKQTAVLRVADTGPGIPADCRESIFQPFFRVDKSRSREMGGVGLGLALVREIAVLHGGSVTVESSSENGTTFVVTLPLAQPC